MATISGAGGVTMALAGLARSDRLSIDSGTGGMPVSNWVHFRERIVMLLDVYGLKEVVLEGISRAENTALDVEEKTTHTDDGEPTSTSVSSRAIGASSQLANKDKAARHVIMSSVMNTELVSGCASAHDMWLKLVSRFEVRTLAHEMFVRDRLTSVKFVTGQSLDAHIDSMMKLRAELKTMGVGAELDDVYMSKLLIQSMPYADFDTTILA